MQPHTLLFLLYAMLHSPPETRHARLQREAREREDAARLIVSDRSGTLHTIPSSTIDDPVPTPPAADPPLHPPPAPPPAPTTANFATIPLASVSDSHVLRIGDIPIYTGMESHFPLDHWLINIESFFLYHPTLSTQHRIAAARTRLAGEALDLVHYYSSNHFASWEEFVDCLRSAFHHHDRQDAARRDLATCRQTTTVRDYHQRFIRIITKLPTLSPDETYYRFLEGLKPEFRQEIAVRHRHVRDFPTAAHIALDFEAHALPHPRPSPSYPPPPPRPPVRLNAMGTPPPPTLRSPLTLEQKLHLISIGGCLYCRQTDHTIDACPTRPPRPARYVQGNGPSQ